MNLDEVWKQIQEHLSQNQFLSGGAVLMVLGAVGALARHWPLKAWYWMVHRVFVTAEVQMADEAFWWIHRWLSAQPYGKSRSRSLTVTSDSTNRNSYRPNSIDEPFEKYGSNENMPKILLTPAPGTHWLLWRKRFVSIRRIREKSQGPGERQSSYELEKESYEISILTRKRSVLMELLLEARSIAYPPEDKTTRIYTPGGKHYAGGWACNQERIPRPGCSVVLREGVYERLSEDIKRFHDSKMWYVERGIPYRRGYLLHGPPGNGKSSTIAALAADHGMVICAANLGGMGITDAELLTMMQQTPKNAIVLLEDIDCVFAQRKRTDGDKIVGITFSGLLNALDGVAAPEGHILVMTTNHPELLDPALIRPGRCDQQLEIGNASREQAERLFLRFFPGQEKLATEFSERTGDGLFCMAALQGHLIRNASDAVLASQFVPPKQGEVLKHGLLGATSNDDEEPDQSIVGRGREIVQRLEASLGEF